MMQDHYIKLVERYFEAETTPEEELALREFLARTDDPAFDEARAVLGYFSAQRSMRAATKGAVTTEATAKAMDAATTLAEAADMTTAAKGRVRILAGVLSAAAAVVLAVILGHASLSLPTDDMTADTCVIYAYGEKNTDTQTVIDDMNQTLSEMFGGSQGPDVTAQLSELFN